jgi:hypothetical protein
MNSRTIYYGWGCLKAKIFRQPHLLNFNGVRVNFVIQ